MQANVSLRVVSAVMTLLLLVACHSSETNAYNSLFALLNSGEGQAMTADQIAHISPRDQLWNKMRNAQGIDIRLPVSDLDVLPRSDVAYVNSETGSQIRFRIKPLGDSLHTVGTMSGEQHEFREVVHNEGILDGYYLQSRGKSIYTVYSNELQYDNQGSIVTDSAGHPLKEPQWQALVLYVYPSADSILITHGHPDSRKVFKIVLSRQQ